MGNFQLQLFVSRKLCIGFDTYNVRYKKIPQFQLLCYDITILFIAILNENRNCLFDIWSVNKAGNFRHKTNHVRENFKKYIDKEFYTE